MSVIKYIKNRQGVNEPLKLNKIIDRLTSLSTNPIYGKRLKNIDVLSVTGETVKSLFDGVTTTAIDNQSCAIALSRYIGNSNYGKLAARIAISSLIKNIKYYFNANYSDIFEVYHYLSDNEKYLLCYCKALEGVLAPNIIKLIKMNLNEIANILCEANNYKYEYRGFYLLQTSYYLLRVLGTTTIVETPDYMIMRIILGTSFAIDHEPRRLTNVELNNIRSVYKIMASKFFTNATPTILNSGTVCPQFASCFVFFTDDSLESIMKMQKACAFCQKYGGGIGMRVNLRTKNKVISSTNGRTSGLVPWARYTNELGNYINQSGKRPASISPQISVDHPDLIDTINLRLMKDGALAETNHRLYYGVLVSDYFMECVNKNKDWYFISPGKDNNLHNLFGNDYRREYKRLVSNGKYDAKMPAVDVMKAILRVSANSGIPYICNIDTVNYMRNQNAPIYSLNLCVEVTLPANDMEIGVCNLTSITLCKFWSKRRTGSKQIVDRPLCDTIYIPPRVNPITHVIYWFDIEAFEFTVRSMVRMLNNTIDNGFYPDKRCSYSNRLRRPIGIGINSLADMLCKLGIIFGSDEACELRANMEELILFFAMDESCRMAQMYGAIANHSEYRSGRGDLHPLRFARRWPVRFAFKCDWTSLSNRVVLHGLYNSVFRCNMPTNNSSLIIGRSPCFEPYESNIYKFNAFSNELVIINKYIERYLPYLNIDIDRFRKRFISLSGRMTDINLDFFIKPNTNYPGLDRLNLFKQIFRVAAFEITPYEIIDMCAAAQPFVDQAQSMNLWVNNVSINTFNYLYYAHVRGLKTLVYYLKSNTSTKEKVCTNCVL